MYSAVASIINVAKWVMLGAIVFGEKIQIWQMLNVAPPSAYAWSQENKIVACLTVFFLSNTIESALLQTGAFEVEFNGIPIWSKLKTGRIPQGDELFEALNSQLRLSTGNQKIPDFSKPPPQYNPPDDIPSQRLFDDTTDEKKHKVDTRPKDDFEEFNTDTRDNVSPLETHEKEEYDDNSEFGEFDTGDEERSEL